MNNTSFKAENVEINIKNTGEWWAGFHDPCGFVTDIQIHKSLKYKILVLTMMSIDTLV